MILSVLQLSISGVFLYVCICGYVCICASLCAASLRVRWRSEPKRPKPRFVVRSSWTRKSELPCFQIWSFRGNAPLNSEFPFGRSKEPHQPRVNWNTVNLRGKGNVALSSKLVVEISHLEYRNSDSRILLERSIVRGQRLGSLSSPRTHTHSAQRYSHDWQ